MCQFPPAELERHLLKMDKGMALPSKLGHSGTFLVEEATDVRVRSPVHYQHPAAGDSVSGLEFAAFKVSVRQEGVGFFWLPVGSPYRAYEKAKQLLLIFGHPPRRLREDSVHGIEPNR